MGDVAASGGVYVAMAASEIVANPGTVTGSIGVIIRSTNLIHLYEKIGIEPKVIKSGRHKDMLATYRSFSDEEKILLQTVIDDSHRQFVEAVSESRAKSLASVEQIADGRIMTGRQALESGLVDHLGDLEFAIERARSLAGLPGQPRLIYVRIRRGRLQRLFNRMAEYTSGLPTGAGLKGLPLWMLPTA
jgi:protease-4